MHTVMRPRSFGEILDGGFQIFRRHFLVLGLTTLLPSAVSALATVALTRTMFSTQNPGAIGFAFIPLWLAIMCITVLVWGALTWQTSEACTGAPVTVVDGLRAGARSFFRLIGTGILCYMLVWVGLMVLVIPLGIVAAILIPALSAGGGGGAAGVVFALIGIASGIGMLIGMVAVAGVLACTLPAVVVEGLGPARAIGRSRDLTRGAVLRSGALLMVAFLITFLPTFAVMFLTGQLEGLFSGQPVEPSLSTLFIQQMAMLAVGAFSTPFLAAVVTVLYYDRRVRTEALDVQLAAHRLQDAQPVAQQ